MADNQALPLESLLDIAKTLDNAARQRTAIRQLELQIGISQAYKVQALSIAQRIARGERRAGIKMGLTSKVKMMQVGLQEVLLGRLTDHMQHVNGGDVRLDDFIQPRAEPEIAFLLKSPLAGKITEPEAREAIAAVAPAIEILDSRFSDFRFNVDDAIADNCSSSAFFIGEWNAPDTPFANLGMAMEFNGKPVALGSSAAILGDPIRSLVAAAEIAARNGERLEAGDIFLSGASTAAIPLQKDTHVRLRVQSLGRCDFTVR